MVEEAFKVMIISSHNDSKTLPEVGNPGVLYLVFNENGEEQHFIWHDGAYCMLWAGEIRFYNTCEEFDKLVNLLVENGIYFKIRDCLGGKQVVGYHDGVRYWDVVIHPYSYGYESGLLEMMGPMVRTDGGVIGYLTAEDCMAILDGTYKWE